MSDVGVQSKLTEVLDNTCADAPACVIQDSFSFRIEVVDCIWKALVASQIFVALNPAEMIWCLFGQQLDFPLRVDVPKTGLHSDRLIHLPDTVKHRRAIGCDDSETPKSSKNDTWSIEVDVNPEMDPKMVAFVLSFESSVCLG